MYSAKLLDHFEHPRNAGELAHADAHVRVENPACGDILELFLRIEDGRIAEIRFRAKGCVPAIACGSALTELMNGKLVGAAQSISREELVQALDGLPEASGHAAQLAVDAVKAVLQDLPSDPS